MFKYILKSRRSIPQVADIIQRRIVKKRYSNKSLKRNSNIKTPYVQNKNFLSFFNSIDSFVDSQEIINYCNAILSNRIKSINSELIEISGDLDWHYDYINQNKFPLHHFSKIKTKDINKKTDVKHVWESSRFYFITNLAKGYKITGNKEFLFKVEELIQNWYEYNPLNIGVNWVVSMEVAIRLVNLIEIQALLYEQENDLKQSKLFDLVNLMICEHVHYLEKNYEKGFNSNNHYLSNLIGLIYGYTYMYKTTNMKNKNVKLLKIIKELRKELKYQIYEDGFSYEDSTAYHALNTEMILIGLIFAKKNIPEINKNSNFIEIEKILKKMTIALYSVTNDGEIPAIGDIDNGRLIIVNEKSNENKKDFTYLIDLAAEYYDIEFEEKDKRSNFSDAGIFIREKNGSKVIFKCGKIGVNGVGGHSHNDQLSVLVYRKGNLIFTDPGTGSYTTDFSMRKKLRSTSSHNTLEIDGVEQNDIDFDFFRLTEHTNSEVIDISENAMSGRIQSYLQQLKVLHSREIKMIDNEIIIVDELTKKTEKNVRINFILDPKVNIEVLNAKQCFLNNDNSKLLLTSSQGNISLESMVYSESYGELQKTKKLIINLPSNFTKNVVKVVAY